MANFRLKPRSELSAALAADSRQAFVGVALFSALLNVLYLTGSFYMLEVYDRVLPSRSVPTLVGITLLALILFSIQGVFDIVRSRILVRVGSSLDEAVSERVHHVLMKLPLKGSTSLGMQPLSSWRCSPNC
jgi:ATP-binding cassette subfamily C protein